MVEFTIKIHPEQRLAYIPKEIYAVLSPRVKAIPNRVAVLVYSEKVSMEDVLKSLDIIKADLLHAQQLQKKQRAS